MQMLDIPSAVLSPDNESPYYTQGSDVVVFGFIKYINKYSNSARHQASNYEFQKQSKVVNIGQQSKKNIGKLLTTFRNRYFDWLAGLSLAFLNSPGVYSQLILKSSPGY